MSELGIEYDCMYLRKFYCEIIKRSLTENYPLSLLHYFCVCFFLFEILSAADHKFSKAVKTACQPMFKLSPFLAGNWLLKYNWFGSGFIGLHELILIIELICYSWSATSTMRLIAHLNKISALREREFFFQLTIFIQFVLVLVLYPRCKRNQSKWRSHWKTSKPT